MITDIILSTIIYSTPLMLAAIGGFYSEKAGVVNIALEGMMLLGAFFAVLGTYLTGNVILGLIFAITCGGIAGFLHGYFSVYLKCNHIISGVAINIMALGVTGFMMKPVFNMQGSSPSVNTIPAGPWNIPLLFLFAMAVIFFTSFWSRYTKPGLRHRAVGESILSSTHSGINVKNTRLKGVMVSGLLASLAGAHLSIGELGAFVERMTAGQGFIALAALILAKWKPIPVIFTCLFFGFTRSISEQIELWIPEIEADLVLMLPFIIVLITLTGFIGHIRTPGDLAKNTDQ